MTAVVRLAIVCLPLSWGATAAPEDIVVPLRSEFAKSLSMIHPGMSADAVLQLLGKPDDVRTTTHGTEKSALEIWSWGTSGHKTLGTLGTIYLTRDHRVQYSFGGSGTPIADKIVPEVRVRHLLHVIDLVASPNDPDDYDPQTVIDAVNELVLLGPIKAEAVFREYLRVAPRIGDPGREGSILILRVLFALPETGELPAPALGVPRPALSAKIKRLPRFPIVLEGDIPFLIVKGYVVGGAQEGPETHLDRLLAVARMRATPLHPTKDIKTAAVRVLAILGPATELNSFVEEQASKMSRRRPQ